MSRVELENHRTTVITGCSLASVSQRPVEVVRSTFYLKRCHYIAPAICGYGGIWPKVIDLLIFKGKYKYI